MEFLDSNFDRAIAEARLAMEKNPEFLRAHAFYAYYLLHFNGDTDASLREYETALNLDPERNDTTIKALLYEPYLFKREFDTAIQKCQSAVDLEPRNPFAHYNLAQAYQAAGIYAKCLDELKAGDLYCGAKPETIEPRYEKLHKALAVSPQELLKVRLEEVNANPNSDAYDQALLHARLGEWEAAVVLLKQAFEKKPSRSMVGILGEPCWDPVRNEKWFQEKLQKMCFHPVASPIQGESQPPLSRAH
jgi:tetratricopeptide (TPR) repeat protein